MFSIFICFNTHHIAISPIIKHRQFVQNMLSCVQIHIIIWSTLFLRANRKIFFIRKYNIYNIRWNIEKKKGRQFWNKAKYNYLISHKNCFIQKYFVKLQYNLISQKYNIHDRIFKSILLILSKHESTIFVKTFLWRWPDMNGSQNYHAV